MTEAGSERWRRAATVLWRRSFDRLVIDVGRSDEQQIVECTGTAVDIWDLLARERSFVELSDELRARYEVGDDELQADLRRFLEGLEAQGVLCRR